MRARRRRRDLLARELRRARGSTWCARARSTTRGAGGPTRFVESSLARQIVEIALGRAPPRIEVGNLDAVRDFLDVEDVVGAYLRLLDRRRARRASTTWRAASAAASARCSTRCSSSRSSELGERPRDRGGAGALAADGPRRGRRRAAARRDGLGAPRPVRRHAARSRSTAGAPSSAAREEPEPGVAASGRAPRARRLMARPARGERSSPSPRARRRGAPRAPRARPAGAPPRGRVGSGALGAEQVREDEVEGRRRRARRAGPAKKLRAAREPVRGGVAPRLAHGDGVEVEAHRASRAPSRSAASARTPLPVPTSSTRAPRSAASGSASSERRARGASRRGRRCRTPGPGR